MAGERITGTLAAAVTPLRDGGAQLDEDALGALLGFYASTELDGLLVAGTTGEGILLSEPERWLLAELAVAGSGRLRTIVHCGAQTTRETSALAAHAAEAGARGEGVPGCASSHCGPRSIPRLRTQSYSLRTLPGNGHSARRRHGGRGWWDSQASWRIVPTGAG